MSPFNLRSLFIGLVTTILAAAPTLASSVKGRAAPYASLFHREKTASIQRYGINIFDLYPDIKNPYETSPFLDVVAKKNKKGKSPCGPDKTFWTPENVACEVESFKEIGLPSTLKKGSNAWLFAPNHIHKVRIESLKIVIPSDDNHSELSVFVSSQEPLPPYRGNYGLIFEKEPPPQTYTTTELPASARRQILAIAKKENAITEGRQTSLGPLIKTSLGNFAYANGETNDEGEFNTSNILFFKQGEKGKWVLLHNFQDQNTQVFADIDGDGVPEFATSTGYKSVHFHKIFPNLEVLCSGTSGT